MTANIFLVFAILLVVIGVLVTEVMPLEVLAMLVLGVLATTGLVSPTEALAGFSNPAVVTIWAVFILSGGLTRTGIANILGRYLLKMVGTGEARLIILIMCIAGGLSAFMNNVAVAALMLPVISGQTLEEISFREKFGLTVLAVYRKGTVIRTGLRGLQLQFGDALLLFGAWKKLDVLGREPDFVVLTEKMQEVAREEKAIMAAVGIIHMADCLLRCLRAKNAIGYMSRAYCNITVRIFFSA